MSEGSLGRAFRAVTDGSAVAGVPVEPSLLDGMRGDDGRLPADTFRQLRRGYSGRGRPPGAGNKRNQKIAQLVCQEAGDPVLFMASLYRMPLDQLVELLRLADDSAAMEERLYRLAENIEADIAKLAGKGNLTKAEGQLVERLVDRLGDIAKVLRVKPGDLAVKALALQKQAAAEVATYVHGRQPVSIDVKGKADMVLLVPGLNAPLGDAKHLEDEVRRRGLEAVDFENMALLPVPDAEDGEFSEVEDEEEGGE